MAKAIKDKAAKEKKPKEEEPAVQPDKAEKPQPKKGGTVAEPAKAKQPAGEAKEKGGGKKKEKEAPKAFIKESIHTVPLRKAFAHPISKRANYALRELKVYIRKHTRKEPVISEPVNKAIWAKGIHNPPRSIKVKIQEEEDRAIAVLP